jgi:AcrR family transcriptional regulator
VTCLAAGGAEAFSANRIAREADVTWGVVQHQFGDADGLWAAVLDELSDRVNATMSKVTKRARSTSGQIKAIVETLWRSLDSPSSQAALNLRYALPHDREVLNREFPQTARALAEFDARWAREWSEAFEGIDISRTKLNKVRCLVPSALRGLHAEARFGGTTTDVAAARAGLIEALTSYLNS